MVVDGAFVELNRVITVIKLDTCSVVRESTKRRNMPVDKSVQTQFQGHFLLATNPLRSRARSVIIIIAPKAPTQSCPTGNLNFNKAERIHEVVRIFSNTTIRFTA